MSEFLLGQHYDITYLHKERGFKNKAFVKELNLINVMFHHSTYLYYFFWTGSEMLQILRKNLVRYRQV